MSAAHSFLLFVFTQQIHQFILQMWRKSSGAKLYENCRHPSMGPAMGEVMPVWWSLEDPQICLMWNSLFSVNCWPEKALYIMIVKTALLLEALSQYLSRKLGFKCIQENQLGISWRFTSLPFYTTLTAALYKIYLETRYFEEW